MKTEKGKTLTAQEAQKLLKRDALFFHPLKLDQILSSCRRDQPETRYPDNHTSNHRPKRS